MNKENTDKLFNRFSMFKPERPITEALMAFGFEHGDGWFNLIWNLCEDLELLAKEENVENFEVFQVKEKFGGLRFYIDYGTDAIHKRINVAEKLSCITCEMCGKPGEISKKKRWIRILCEECDSKRN